MSHPTEPQQKDAIDELSAELATAAGESRAREPGRPYYLETARRLRAIWERFGQGATPRTVSTEIMERESCSRDTADRWVGAALRVLHEDGAAEPIESKRARIVTMALSGYEKAMARTKGFLIVTGKGEERETRLELVPDPDSKGAAMFLAILAKVELGI